MNEERSETYVVDVILTNSDKDNDPDTASLELCNVQRWSEVQFRWNHTWLNE